MRKKAREAMDKAYRRFVDTLFYPNKPTEAQFEKALKKMNAEIKKVIVKELIQLQGQEPQKR